MLPEGTAKEYHQSTAALMKLLGAKLEEIRDWSCCGASAAHHVSDLLALTLAARNLALAEQMCKEKNATLDILVPCSACYLNLKTVSQRVKTEPDLKDTINTVLKEEGLEFKNQLRVRHELDVLFNDFPAQLISEKVKYPLSGIMAAPYYGCQCLRPYAVFDHPEKPVSMEPLIQAVGADVFQWDMGPACCGASHMTTKPTVGMQLTGKILNRAKEADVILTVCPMCQMNLEGFQAKTGQAVNQQFDMSILYLPQFLGMALGLSDAQTGMGLNLNITDAFSRKCQALTQSLTA